ncbi:hypothetical protein PRZ48_010827 [Zasmidium cellare]|uniref:Uncharacterized protein n=1 Tax=Zasmidium cellare TaxID=395010 RepID=A0ABR0E9R1_ZASCE|nr:hypothetical protein PRZ48_010827 [Zasmidium cellare]
MCRQGCSPKVIEMALKATKSVKQRNINGDTLLHLATSTRGRKSHADVLRALLRAGIDVDARSDSYSETALMSSACTGSLDEMEVLLAAGADVNICDDTGGSALAKACWGGSLPAVRLLLDSGANNDFSAKRYFSGDAHVSVFGGAPLIAGPLHLAAEAGNVDLIRLLLENSESPAEDAKATDKASPLWWASYYGQVDIVRLLLQHGFDPDDIDPIENLSCLHIAVVFSQLSVIHLLLEAGCDDQALDRLQRSPMDHAIAYGNQAAIQILASHQSRNKLLRPISEEIPVKPSTPQRPSAAKSQFSPPYIMEIIAKGELETVQRLCESGVDFSLPYAECSCTPLLEAMFLGKISIASYLLDKKVSTKE